MKTFLSLLTFCLSAMVATAAERPNIIMFLIDDQNPSSIAAFGGDTYTPNLDRMAEEGMKFTRAYVSSSVCTPSRYSFLTGRFAGNSHSKLYAEAVGSAENQGYPSFNVALERDKMNVGNVLREAGYTTGFVGKFHLKSPLDFPEFYEGKDGWIEIPNDAAPGPETSEMFKHNERLMRRYLEALGFSWAKNIYGENMSKPYSEHNAEWPTVAALEFIEENQDGPFYLNLCSTLLHGPDKSWRDSMDHPLITGEGEVESLPEVMTPRAELLKTIEEKGFDPDSRVAGEAWIDDSLGAIFRKLVELGIDDNTLVIFAPDHGRDGKASVFSHGAAQVPMIMRWPNGIPAGQVCEELVQNIDLVPTFFELGEAEKPEAYRIDGQSLTPLFENGTADDWRDHLYLEMGAARATITKDWSYAAVRYTKEQIAAIQKATPQNLPRAMAYIGRLGIGVRGADRPGFFDEDQLYYLKRDPKEMENLASNPEQATRLKEMRALLQQDIEAVGRPFGEFIPGGNAAEPGQIDRQIEIVKQLDIQGKKVTVPESLMTNPGTAEETVPDDKAKKKAEREARRKAREEAKANKANGQSADRKPDSNELPNFIFIMTDDQGYGDLGCYGHPTIKTPNIDAMAARGVRFTDFYARHKCSPARASLMSGAYNFRVGVGSIIYPHSSVGTCQETVTIPEVLKEKGYTSALVGKWHLGHAIGYLPTDQGFDSYFGVPGTNHGDSMNHGLPVAEGFQPGGGLTMEDYEADADKGTHGRSTILMRDDRVIEWPTDITQLTKRYTQESVKFIEENKDKPFFLYLAHGTPHHPYTVDASFRGKSAHGFYGDMIEEIDWSVGEILKALKENGLEKNTIVAFTSDNGADSKPDSKGNEEMGSNLPLKGWKGSSDEGGVRVPFVVTWPGTLPKGKETAEMATLMDILPTFAALAGIEPKTAQKIDGKDIFPIMQCLPEAKSPHPYVYYAGNIDRITGARNERFKLTHRGKPALYDLQSDLGETKDVSAEYPEVVQQLEAAIAAFQQDLDEHSLEAPFDAGQAAFKETKEEKSSKKESEKKKK